MVIAGFGVLVMRRSGVRLPKAAQFPQVTAMLISDSLAEELAVASHGRFSPGQAASAWPPWDAWPPLVTRVHRRFMVSPMSDAHHDGWTARRMADHRPDRGGWPGSGRLAGVGEFGQALPDVGDVALVFGVAGVGGGQPLGDRQPSAVVLVRVIAGTDCICGP
jgi:hypothetical protein